MYAVAARLDPDRLPSSGPRHLRGDGPGRVQHGWGVPLRPPPTRRHPYDDPNAMGDALVDGGAGGRSAADAAGHLLPRRWRRPAADPRPAPLRRRRRRGLGRHRRSRPRCTVAGGRLERRGRRLGSGPLGACRPAPGITTVAGSGRPPRDAPARARLRAACGERGLPRGPRAARRRGCWRTTGRSDPGPPRSTPPTCSPTTSTCWPAPAPRSASAPPPSGTSATASARSGSWHAAGVPLAIGTDGHARIDAFEEARSLELDQRLAPPRAWPAPRRRPPGCADRDGHRSLGPPMPAGSRSGPARTWSRWTSPRSAPRGHPARCGWPRWCSALAPSTSPTSWWTAAGSSATASMRSATSRPPVVLDRADRRRDGEEEAER
jgi:hypothetical protein